LEERTPLVYINWNINIGHLSYWICKSQNTP